MPMTAPRVFHAALACLFAMATQAAWPAVLWSENFDAAAPGQVLSAPPLNWTADYGTINLGATPHLGWVGNAIVGTTAVAPGGVSGAQTSIALSGIPTVGVVEFSFDAWASTTQNFYGGSVNLDLSNGNFFYIQAWHNVNFDNEWFLYKWSNAQQRYTTEWNSGSSFMRDRTVHLALLIDYDQQTFNLSFDDGSQVVTTPTFALDGKPELRRLSVYQDTRGGFGIDLDNFQITAVPEPGMWLMLSGGLLVLARRTVRVRLRGA